ncbi:MAG: GMC family oxidoreductase [Deltaproteobacteria bacterium]|nr:GMC family oxidoreductase [Deltaproteobacteria bacterium]
MALDPVDVVVVGSGAGGGPVALSLAQAGARVVVLEKGPALQQKDLLHDEIQMCRRNFFVPYFQDEPHTIRHTGDGKAIRTNECWTANVVGGGTVHMSAYFMRMQPVDMKLRSTLGKIDGANVADWPFTYEELEPFYTLAEKKIGVSGRWKAHPFEEPRSEDYPLPPLEEHPYAMALDKVIGGLGYHLFPTPRGINSRPANGRVQCVYCALCGSFPCEVSAKGSTAVTVLPEAVATGKCEIRDRSMATEIRVGPDGRATGVVYRDKDNTEQFQAARAVVVACTAVESARLLLMSQSGKHPKGLGNAGGLVGKNLLFSSLAKGHAVYRYAGRPAADVEWMKSPLPFVQRSMQDFYLLPEPVNGVRKMGTVLFALYHPNPINTVERIAGSGPTALWGKQLKQAIRDEGRNARCLDFETFGEFLATDMTTVDLDPEVKDKWGLPVARITIGRHPHDITVMRTLAEKGMQVLNALKPDSTKLTISQGETKILQGGTCRAGTDPATSVLNKDCRAHTVPNLWVSDGSFMPTSGGVPFTLTILANAFRVGARMVEAFKAGKL